MKMRYGCCDCFKLLNKEDAINYQEDYLCIDCYNKRKKDLENNVRTLKGFRSEQSDLPNLSIIKIP